ncbi:hypothetical protein AVEN_1137-1 [Araneus ventricosus]|uniref:Uncharacterized protein n=1 Tax=Araneus ventricosus TaxID=182803 RepID=A0A4Y2LIG8_ARAVE|nr:hypothetical protein AVEN_1137-1 [Araneus ventricosus]
MRCGLRHLTVVQNYEVCPKINHLLLQNGTLIYLNQTKPIIPLSGQGTVPVLPVARDISLMLEIRADIVSHVSMSWQRFKCFTQYQFGAPYANQTSVPSA